MTSIGNNAFMGCTGLTNIIIPSSVTSIGWGAFVGCTGLTRILIPNSVTSIGGSAFFGCWNLTIYAEATGPLSGWSGSWNLLDVEGNRIPVVWGFNIYAPPISLIGQAGDERVSLSWEAPTTFLDVNVYRIYRDGERRFATTELSFVDTDNLINWRDYTYYITAVYIRDGVLHESVPSNTVIVIPNPVSDDDEVVDMFSTALLGNFPNPFNPYTSINFVVARHTLQVHIEVFDIRGRLIRTLLDGSREFGAGSHSVVWDGRDDVGREVSSGIYFYRMRAGEYQSVRKMILMK